MEVHAHSHSVPIAIGRKKWTHYLWEFLMLFLAVFCGFLAENQREHMIEHKREKQYMQSFNYDLQNDTTNLNFGFPRKEGRLKAIDTVFLFFEQHPDITEIPGAIYRKMIRTLWDRHYRRNSTTIDQLKNAGAMRLIRNKRVADSIAAYDLHWQRADFWIEAYHKYQDRGEQLLEKIVNASDLISAYRNNPPGGNLPASVADGLTIKINRQYLNEFLNHLNNSKNIVYQDWRDYLSICGSAERLITMINEEYHLSERTLRRSPL